MLQNLWNILYLFVTSILVWSLNSIHYYSHWAFQVALVANNMPVNAGDTRDMGSVPGLGRSPGGGHGNPFQFSSCLENSMHRGAWRAAVHGVAKSWTRLSDFTFTFMHWRRKWQPTPVFLPGESQGQWSLVGSRLWGRTELDTTEAT